MRIHFDGLVRPKLVAKSLRKALSAEGTELSLGRCQAVASRMFGYADWHDLVRHHAAAPASPDDDEAGVAVAAQRRLQYGRVLSELGIDPLTIPGILDAVRPTDRSRADAPAPSSFPRFLIEAFETDREGNRIRSLGMQDLTWQVVSEMVLPGRRAHIVRDMEIPPRMITIHSALTDEARVAGFEGRLAMPGFEETLAAFLAMVGPREALPGFRQRMDDVSMLRSRIKSAARELAEVERARFTTRFSDFEMFHASHEAVHREFPTSASEAYEDWGWDAYVAEHPRPDWQEEKARAAWNAAYGTWVRQEAPPWVFGTIKDNWSGVDAKDIRECAEDGGHAYNIENIVDDSLSDHHEDAGDDVVDMDDLCGIVSKWWPHAGTGSAEDLALEAAVAKWNSRQRVASYFPDARVILPTRMGLTQADAVSWCKRRLGALQGELAALMVWSHDSSEARPDSEIQRAS